MKGRGERGGGEGDTQRPDGKEGNESIREYQERQLLSHTYTLSLSRTYTRTRDLSIHCARCSRNLPPKTLHPKPYTLNPKPELAEPLPPPMLFMYSYDRPWE